jgi:hypothetical protein
VCEVYGVLNWLKTAYLHNTKVFVIYTLHRTRAVRSYQIFLDTFRFPVLDSARKITCLSRKTAWVRLCKVYITNDLCLRKYAVFNIKIKRKLYVKICLLSGFRLFSTSFPRGNTQKNKVPAHVQHVRRKAKKLSPCVPSILFAFFWCRRGPVSGEGKKEAHRTGGRNSTPLSVFNLKFFKIFFCERYWCVKNAFFHTFLRVSVLECLRFFHMLYPQIAAHIIDYCTQ